MEYLRRKTLGQSVNRRFAAIAHFFETCVAWDLIKANPAVSLKKLPATRQRAKRSLQKEELQLLLKAASPWLRDILWFILENGLRRSQAVFLRWASIDFKSKVIYLESSDGFDPKDREPNTIPMSSDAEILEPGIWQGKKDF